MKPRYDAFAGTPEHRAHVAEVARDLAMRVAEALGTGELGGMVYRGLPVGDRRCDALVRQFLDTVEQGALALFDRAVACRDLPETHNIIPMKRTA